MATDYTINNARLALPHLVYHAQMHETITYGEISRKINRHWRAARYFLGFIRDNICFKKGLPYISAIVVNAGTRMPGKGFLPKGTEGLSKEEYRQRFEKERDKVFACNKWDDLLKELDLEPIQKTAEDLDQEGIEYTKFLKRTGGGESKQHKQLKNYIAKNPKAIGLSLEKEGEKEFPFISGDECDVIFDLGKEGFAVIEVKNGQRGELVKGLYQAIKYRALMEAQKGGGKRYPVKAFLVAYSIPRDIADYASRFGVECKAFDRNIVEKFTT